MDLYPKDFRILKDHNVYWLKDNEEVHLYFITNNVYSSHELYCYNNHKIKLYFEGYDVSKIVYNDIIYKITDDMKFIELTHINRNPTYCDRRYIDVKLKDRFHKHVNLWIFNLPT